MYCGRCSKIFIYLILCVLASQSGSFSIGNNTRSISRRYRRQDNCNGFNIKCPTSGECIDENKYCDGHVDCLDGSDETNRCSDLNCPSYVFRCKYGACINRSKQCDGKKDCKDGSDETGPKCKRQTSTICNDTEFECKSGECINEDFRCDGKPQCKDNSDETIEACASMNCPKYTFKCDYGACIAKKGVCDDKKDCFDGSDENPDLCKSGGSQKPPVKPVTQVTSTVRPTTGTNRPPVTSSPGNCVLPPQIDKGAWSVWSFDPNAKFDYRSGDKVKQGTILQVKCNNGYIPDRVIGLILCNGGVWNQEMPKCIQICPILRSTVTTIISCTFNGLPQNCSEPISHTKAKFKCAPFHELSSTENSLYCLDGSWDYPTPVCTPVCGKKNARIKELIIGGEIVERGSYPWTVALYKKKKDEFHHVCGGSLVSDRVIVTAAHCVTNREGEKEDVNSYRVAAGKYWRTYDDAKDTEAQFSEVKEMFVPTYYKASTSFFQGDIAVLITKEAFNATEYIQRICVDWDQDSTYESQLLGTNGTVTGWGYTVRGSAPSEVLKEISLPYVGYSSCYSDLPDDYKSYLTPDKMCAGYLDRGIGVCEGDSGGGLAFLQLQNRRYYLRGVVSVAPQDIKGSCDENEYALYTKISNYITLIQSKVRAYH